MAQVVNENPAISFDGEMMILAVGNELHKMAATELYDRMESKRDHIDALLNNIAASLLIEGIAKTNTAAIVSHVSSKTFKRIK